MRRRSAVLRGILALVALGAGASLARAGAPAAAPPFESLRLAIFPVDNLAGVAAPTEALREALAGRLAARGVALLDPEILREVLAARRVRWVGGVDAGTAKVLWEQQRVNAVLITHLDLVGSSDQPPRVGLTARLLRTGPDDLSVAWATSVALAGEENPGFLDLGFVSDPVVLTSRALDRLTDELMEYLRTGLEPPPKGSAQRRFQPRAFHATPEGLPLGGEPLRIAVLPFSNDSARRHAGEILGYHYVAALLRIPGLTIVEPGEVRRVLLETRLIQEGGLTYAQAELLRGLLDVDLVVTGTVFDYADAAISGAAPFAGFTTTGIDARRRQVAWVAFSYATGLDRVVFFNAGEIRTVDRLVDELIRGVVGAARR